MKKVNLIIIATIMATFAISMFAFQPTKAEASNKVLPTATPTPRKIKKPTSSVITLAESHQVHSSKHPRGGHQHKPLVKQSQEKEPATMEIPNLIKANPRRRHRH